jgi:hypothetical protein
MKLKEYMEKLELFVKENPEALEMDVVTSRDDEGNGYNQVYYSPSIGIFEDGDFIPSSQIKEYEREPKEINSVCLN